MPDYTLPVLVPQPVRTIAPGTQVFIHFPTDVVAAALEHAADIRMWGAFKPKRAKAAVTVGVIITADIVWALHNRVTTVMDVSVEAGYIGGEITGLVPVFTNPGELTYVLQESVFPVVDGAPVLPDTIPADARVPIDIPLTVCYDSTLATAVGDVPFPEQAGTPDTTEGAVDGVVGADVYDEEE